MSPHPHEIEIKEPPIQELNKKRSCLKRSCVSIFSCILIFLIAAVSLLWMATHPRSKEVKTVPGNFPASIPVYDPDAMKSIQVFSGKKNSRWLKTASYLPTVIADPLLAIIKTVSRNTDSLSWQQFTIDIAKNTRGQRDVVRIEWKHLSAQPKFIARYYRAELQNHGYVVTGDAENDVNPSLYFKKDDTDGSLSIQDDNAKEGTDAMTMIVNIP